MRAHTPGPWIGGQIGGDKDPGISIGAEDGSNVAFVYHEQLDREPTETRANARLIVAAPDLLEALKEATRTLIGERDCLYDSITDSEGNIVDLDDGEGLALADEQINRFTALIKAAGGEL